MRRWIRYLAFLLTGTLVFMQSISVVAMTSTYPSSDSQAYYKALSDKQMTQYIAYSHGPFPMTLCLRLTEQEFHLLSLDQKWEPQYEYTYKDVDEEIESTCAVFVEGMLHELGIEDAPLVFGIRYTYGCMCRLQSYYPPADRYETVLTVWLTEEEIARVESHERVAGAYLISAMGFCPVDVYTGRASADLALRILQCSVGLSDQVPCRLGDWEFDTPTFLYGDFNRDMQINAADALLVLQKSVALIEAGKIAWLGKTPGNCVYPLSPTDWDVTEPLFLYSSDVNGDGHADLLDILWKYRDLWA